LLKRFFSLFTLPKIQESERPKPLGEYQQPLLHTQTPLLKHQFWLIPSIKHHKPCKSKYQLRQASKSISNSQSTNHRNPKEQMSE